MEKGFGGIMNDLLATSLIALVSGFVGGVIAWLVVLLILYLGDDN